MFLVRVETGRPLGAWFAHQRTVGIPKISAYRVAGDVHGFGDLANRLFPLQLVDGLGLSTLQQAYTPPTLGRNRMRFLLRVGAVSFSVRGPVCRADHTQAVARGGRGL